MKAKAAGPQLPPETIVKTNGGAVNVKTTEPVGDTTKPYLDKVVDKSAPRDHVKSDAQKRMAPTGADLSEAYTPLQDHELFGKDFTHKEFGAYEAKLFNNKMVEKAAERDRVKNAAKKNKMAPTEDVLAKETPMHDHEDLTHNEFGAYEPIKNKSGVRDLESYSLGVQRDHRSYEHILQALSQHSVGVDDTPALQRLLTELYHVRRADTALRAVNHFSQLMTPALRDRVRSRLDVSFVRSHWSKHSKDE